jgi:hypothetical protein
MRQQELLQRAIAKAGSGRALAQLLERAETRIPLWKSGREPMPDEVIYFLAEYVGESPTRALAEIKGGLWRKLTAASLACALVVAPSLWQNEAAASPRFAQLSHEDYVKSTISLGEQHGTRAPAG